MISYRITKRTVNAKEECAKSETKSQAAARDANDSCKVHVVTGRDMHQDFLSLVNHFCNMDELDESSDAQRVKRRRLAFIEEKVPICTFTGTGFYTEHHVSTRHHFAVKRTEMRAYFRLLGRTKNQLANIKRL